MFNWVLNKSLNFDLFYLLLVDIWKWLVCLVPWEKFFSLSSMHFRSILGFLSDDRFQMESKKQAQWFSNILICDIRCLDNCPRGKVPPVGLGLWFVLGLGGTIFPEENCPRTAKFTFQNWWNLSEIYYIIINLLGHEQICLMRLIEHIHWWRVLINENWKDRQKYS